jgi:hypothetical protein
MPEEQCYWGVECKGCKGLMPLAHAIPPGGKTVEWLKEIVTFDVTCPGCSHKEEYERGEVIKFWGPQAPQDFREHPAFQRSGT